MTRFLYWLAIALVAAFIVLSLLAPILFPEGEDPINLRGTAAVSDAAP